jgi:hypothetical protein
VIRFPNLARFEVRRKNATMRNTHYV